MLGVAAAQPFSSSSTNTAATNIDNTSPSQRPNKNVFDSIPTNDFGFVPDATTKAAANPFDALDTTNSVAAYTIEKTRAKAEKGDVEAQVALGRYYCSVTNYVEAAKWNLKAAEQGNPMAQALIGLSYYGGLGVSKNYVEAVKWYRKAAEQGNCFGQTMLAGCYKNGIGVLKDEDEAAGWYRKAAENKDTAFQIEFAKLEAEQGDSLAQRALGLAYYAGHGVPQDDAEAAKWFQKAAEQGDSRAQLYLGRFYANGTGVQKDADEAVKWLHKAAEQGEAEAQAWLGSAYAQQLYGEHLESLGLPQDYAQAVKWFRRAANQGHASAQAALGICYMEGHGVPKNQVEAYKWFNLAAAQSPADAVTKMSEAGRTLTRHDMTGGEIAEAQRLSSEFVPRKEKSDSISNDSTSPKNPTATGTGFFITDDGYLISNYHVVKDATKVRLVTSAGLIDAKVVQVDAANDLALLKADGRFAPLPIAASRTVSLGGTVATIGFPNIGMQGFAPKLAKGEIASLSGAGDDPRYFQISVPVQPGNSGGALVDDRGNVIGIVSAKLDASAALAASGALPENVNYAVKSSLLMSFLESVPAVSAKLKAPVTSDRKFGDVVKSAQDAAVLVLVY